MTDLEKFKCLVLNQARVWHGYQTAMNMAHELGDKDVYAFLESKEVQVRERLLTGIAELKKLDPST